MGRKAWEKSLEELGKKKSLEDALGFLAVGNGDASSSGVQVKLENPLWPEILKCKETFMSGPYSL